MPTVVVRHKVGDFETCVKGHNERQELFAPAISGFQTFQDKDDPGCSLACLVYCSKQLKINLKPFRLNSKRFSMCKIFEYGSDNRKLKAFLVQVFYYC